MKKQGKRKNEFIFIIGGARSGKSAFAEEIARSRSKVLFVATAEALDDEMAMRITAHKSKRPESWTTLEEPFDLFGTLKHKPEEYDTIVIDCLTLWVSNCMIREGGKAIAFLLSQTNKLLELADKKQATWIVVTNEVGLGLVPESKMSRKYRDLLGTINQLFAERADKVYSMTAGIGVDIRALSGKPY